VDTTDVLEIVFYYKISSEEGNLRDELYFYIDDTNRALAVSGETGWRRFSYPVTDGPHKFEWVYQKDHQLSHGQDCVWIDKISFVREDQ